jgi:hypothetical protein
LFTSNEILSTAFVFPKSFTTRSTLIILQNFSC